MNVSVPAMSRFALLVIVVAACGDDPSLQIEVVPPANEDYRRLITRTEVTVYESELDTLTCEQIEFGDVSDDLLAGAAVARQTLHAGGRVEGTLDDISRLGKKLVVARLTTDTGVLIAAGCTEQGDVDGDAKIVVTTEVAATVAIDTSDADDPYGKQVTIVDPLGNSLADHEVRWRLFAPAGAVPDQMAGVTIDADQPTTWDSAQPACTDARGIATLRLVPPAKVSGFAARFRVAWPAKPIGVISGFVRPGFGGASTPDPPATNRCAIRTAGERRIVCAQDVGGSPTAHRYEIAQGPLKGWNVTDRGSVALPSRPAGVFAFDEPAGKEVYAVLANGNVQNLFGTTPLVGSGCADCAIDDLRVAPACGDDPARIYMHSATGSPIRVIPVHGGPVAEFPLPSELGAASVRLNAAGCVTTINAAGVEKDVQIVVLDVSSADGGTVTRGLFRCGLNRLCVVTLPFPGTGVGFLEAGTATRPERQMIGTAFDIAGAELVGWVLRPTFDGNTYLLLDRQRITAAAPPGAILVGKLDDDDSPDLMWSIGGVRSSLLQASYGQTIEDGSRLSALAPLSALDVEEMTLGDLDGDGFDDLVGMASVCPPMGQPCFVVVPQNVDGPPVARRTQDSACE